MSMPKRPKEHQVEDLSINALKNLLPREWVYREKEKDYGIDGEIEIFNEEGYATGIIFYVQLKATDSIIPNVQSKVQLSNESINYYESLELPTLIVRYVEEEKTISVKWAHKIDRYKQKKDSKSFSFHMNEINLWDENTPNSLVNDVRKITTIKSKNDLLPINTYLNFEFNNLKNISVHRLKSNLRIFLTKKENIINIVASKEEAILSINISNDTLFVDIGGFDGCYFHSIDSYDYTYEELIGDIFVAVTIGLFHLGKKFNAITIFESLVENGLILKNPEILIMIIEEYALLGESEKVIKLWESILDEDKDEMLNMRYHMIISMSSEHNNSSEMYEHYLMEQIEKFKALDEKIHFGIACYNFANFLRGRNNKKSFTYYNKALKNNPHYNNEDYIFKEIGGILFDLGKFDMSSQCYKKGLELKEDLHRIVLYADALMLQGKYLNAKEKFIEYFEKKKENIDAEWYIKESILGVIVNDYNIKEQKRNYKKAMNHAHIKQCKGKKIPNEEYQYIINNIDALNPLCHFNLAISTAEEENHHDTMIHFLICAIVNRNDVEAWLNSFKGALGCQQYELIPLIISCAYNICEESFLNVLYSFIEDNPERKDSELTRQFVGLIDEVVTKVNEKKSAKNLPLLRVFNGEKFEEIEKFLEKKKTDD